MLGLIRVRRVLLATVLISNHCRLYVWTATVCCCLLQVKKMTSPFTNYLQWLLRFEIRFIFSFCGLKDLLCSSPVAEELAVQQPLVEGRAGLWTREPVTPLCTLSSAPPVPVCPAAQAALQGIEDCSFFPQLAVCILLSAQHCWSRIPLWCKLSFWSLWLEFVIFKILA